MMNLQNYYETVMQLSHGIVLTLDLDGCIIHGNSELEELSGYTMKELAGQDWFTIFLTEGSRQRARDRVFASANRPGVSFFSGSITTRNGETVFIDWNLKPLIDSTGEVISILCVGKDVTDHMKRQKGLLRERFTLMERNKGLHCLYQISQIMNQAERDLEDILEDVVVLLPRAYQLPERTLVRMTIDGHIWETPGYTEMTNQITESVEINRRYRGSITVAVDDSVGEQSSWCPIFLDEEKSLLATVAQQVASLIIKREAREARQTLEQQLRQADRLAKIGQFSAGVAHEINEPLANILGYAELALQAEGLPEQVRADLGSIVDSSLHAREIIRKLMFFSRQLPPQKVPTDINELIDQALRITETGAKLGGIRIERRFEETLPKAMADPQHIKQVLVNIIANAIQAMDEGGVLTVETLSHCDDVYVIVEDTGAGMGADELKQIFTPFYTTKDLDKGTGLGLSVVHGIVEAHGGFIQVESQPGEGTRVELALPCNQEAAQ